MKKILSFLLLVLCSLDVFANTPAGTTISNQATVSFKQGANSLTINSNVISFLVNELVDVSLSWVDASQVVVNSPDTRKALTFKLTNTGNGIQKYILTQNNSIGGGAFNPAINGATIYIENSLQSGLQISSAYEDIIYTEGSVITLAPNEYKYIYLVYDINNGLLPNSKGFAQINVVSTTTGVSTAQKPGTIYTAKTPTEVSVILGYSMGKASAIGNYIVSGLIVNHVKSVVSIQDINGGNLVESGSVITYQILVNLSGQGTAQNLQIVDQLPVSLTYVPNSLVLNGTNLPDTGNVLNNGVTINLNNQSSGANFILILKAKIN